MCFQWIESHHCNFICWDILWITLSKTALYSDIFWSFYFDMYSFLVYSLLLQYSIWYIPFVKLIKLQIVLLTMYLCFINYSDMYTVAAQSIERQIDCFSFFRGGLANLFRGIGSCTFSEVGSRTFSEVGSRTFSEVGSSTFSEVGSRTCSVVGSRTFSVVGSRTFWFPS